MFLSGADKNINHSTIQTPDKNINHSTIQTPDKNIKWFMFLSGVWVVKWFMFLSESGWSSGLCSYLSLGDRVVYVLIWNLGGTT
jgi:hypothetical protein